METLVGPAGTGQGVGITEQRSNCLSNFINARGPRPLTFRKTVPPVTISSAVNTRKSS